MTPRLYPTLEVENPNPNPNPNPNAASKVDNASMLDPLNPDYSRFPLSKEAKSEELIARLGPGDSLFIPQGWWHHVHATSRSASISYWF